MYSPDVDRCLRSDVRADSRHQVPDSEPEPDLPVDGGYTVIAGVAGDTHRPAAHSPANDHHAVGAAADPVQTATSSAPGPHQRQDGCYGDGGPLDDDQFQWDVMVSKLGTTRMLLELVMSAKHHNRRHGNRQPDAIYISPGGVLQPITVLQPSRAQSGPGGAASHTGSDSRPQPTLLGPGGRPGGVCC